MSYEIIFSDYKEVLNRNGESLQFIKFYPKNNNLLCWSENKKSLGEAIITGVNIKEIKIDSLKAIAVWDKLSDKQRQGLEAQEKEDVSNTKSLRKPRNLDNVGLPKKLRCVKCDKDKMVSVPQLRKMMAKLKVDVVEVAKDYVCRKCKKAIREKNPLKNGLDKNGFPKKLHCVRCGKDKMTTPIQIQKMMAKTGIGLDKIGENYICKSCKKQIRLDSIIKT